MSDLQKHVSCFKLFMLVANFLNVHIRFLSNLIKLTLDFSGWKSPFHFYCLKLFGCQICQWRYQLFLFGCPIFQDHAKI